MCRSRYCETDLDKLLHGKDATLRVQYTPEVMIKLIRDIITGLCYCHDMGKCHLDIKPDNCLLANDGSGWTVKLADFGAQTSEDNAEKGEEADQAEAGDQHGQTLKTGQWLGTYLWMPPECCGINAGQGYVKGQVCTDRAKETAASKFGASDWFSFGIMVWEMVARERPSAEALNLSSIGEVWVSKDGKERRDVARGSEPEGGEWTKDFLSIARAYYNGTRPEIPDDCPTLLSKLMVACWQDKQQERPTSTFMRRLATTDELPVERWLQVPPAEPKMRTFVDFLMEIGLHDKKEALAEYLEEGNELRDLKQMDEDELNEDVLDDGDLGLDESVKARFRAAVAGLKGAGDVTAAACSALEAAAGLPAEAASVEAMQRKTNEDQAEKIAELEARLAAFEGAPPAPM